MHSIIKTLVLLFFIVVSSGYITNKRVNFYLKSQLAKNRFEVKVQLKYSDEETENVAKLKSEIAAPFRLFRQYFYVAMGAAGGIGLVTSIPQLIFAAQDGRDVSAVLTNIFVNIGGVVGGTFLWIKESEAQKNQIIRFKEKQLKMNNQLTSEELIQSETLLSKLPIEIQVSEIDGNITKIVSFQELQSKGNQHIIVVAGKTNFIKDAVISARIEGSDLFSSKETIVVPFVYQNDQLEDSLNKGFGEKETENIMTAPYIAKPKQVFLIFL
jgi:hypothetical protein